MCNIQMERLLEVWNYIKDQKYNQFMPADFFDFYHTWSRDDQVYIDKDWAIARIADRYKNRATLHGYILDHRALYDVGDRTLTLLSVMESYGLRRLQCAIPCCIGSLGRYLEKMGFDKEGTLRDYLFDGKIYYDADMYALLRR